MRRVSPGLALSPNQTQNPTPNFANPGINKLASVVFWAFFFVAVPGLYFAVDGAIFKSLCDDDIVDVPTRNTV